MCCVKYGYSVRVVQVVGSKNSYLPSCDLEFGNAALKSYRRQTADVKKPQVGVNLLEKLPMM